jgi:O-antigen/teichoic acid export membrane protein
MKSVLTAPLEELDPPAAADRTPSNETDERQPATTLKTAGGVATELKFLLRHSSIYGLGNMLGRAVAFLLLPLYTRYLTPTDYGVLELLEVTTSLAGFVASLGAATAMGRFYYEQPNEYERGRLVSTVYGVAVAASLAVVVISWTQSALLGRLVLGGADHAVYFRIAFSGLMLGVLIDIGQVYLRLLYKSVAYITISAVAMVVGVTLNIVFIVGFHSGALGILYAGLINRILVVVPLTFWILRRTGLHFNRALASRLVAYSSPLLLSGLATAVVSFGDRYFIRYFASIADAGVYGLANKLGTALHMLITSPFVMTFAPRRFQIALRADAREVFHTVFDCFFRALLAASLVLAVFVNQIVMVMTTPGFYKAAEYVPLLLLTMLVWGAREHFELGILQSKKTNYYLYITVISSVVQLLLDAVLIRWWGVWGAVYAVFAAVLLQTGLVYVASSRLYHVDFGLPRNTGVLLLALIVYGLSRLVPDTPLVTAVLLKSVLVAAFLVGLVRSKALRPHQASQVWSMAVGLWRRRQVESC